MAALTAFAGVILAIALAAGALPAAGFWWDTLAAVGFCAATIIAFLGWDSESPAGNPRLRLHRNLAFLAAALATGHALGYLITDRTVLEYFKPAAPAYMLAGLGAWIGLVAMTVTSLPGPRRRSFAGFAAFRRWHRALFLAVLAATAWHVLAAGFNLTSRWQQVLAGACLVGLPVLAYWRRRRRSAVPMSPAPAHIAAADSGAIVLGVTMLALSVAYGAIKLLACADC
ncbi:MAG: ferric reductase-like transmembrane domain-containing protein [Pseudomonadales bacterium]